MELTDPVLIRYTQAYKRGLTHVIKRLEERYPDRADRFETVKKTVTNYVKWLENRVQELEQHLHSALTVLELSGKSGLSSTDRSKLHKARQKLRSKA